MMNTSAQPAYILIMVSISVCEFVWKEEEESHGEKERFRRGGNQRSFRLSARSEFGDHLVNELFRDLNIRWIDAKRLQSLLHVQR